MGKLRYFYNPETCDYEPVKPSLKTRVWIVAAYSIAAIVLAVGIVSIYNYHYPSWKEAELTSKQQDLLMKWEGLEQEIQQSMTEVEDFWISDEEMRKILELDSLSPSIREAGFGGSPVAPDLQHFPNRIRLAYNTVEQVKAKVNVQSASFDTLFSYAEERDRFWASIPAIQPVENKNLRRISTVYGMRLNPVLKRWMPHRGFDFMGNTGVPIYATGDGRVEMSQMTFGGFGNLVVIDHGYGYKTRYAHLDSFAVKRGQEVKRGEIIGYMGNTGRSAGVHLHYEILKNGVQVNPIGFFEMELDDDALTRLLEHARKNTIHLD